MEKLSMFTVPADMPLLWALRDVLALTGTMSGNLLRCCTYSRIRAAIKGA
jgi:aerobic-type carbon monoxide dehydrogenase small subunit (CoxS/CutS family)